jgi:hypothetical protein
VLETVISQKDFADPAPPADWDGKNWSEANCWLTALTSAAADSARTETLVKAVYARAVIKLATLNPTMTDPASHSSCPFGATIFYPINKDLARLSAAEKAEIDAPERDRMRALWELRYFDLPPNVVSKVTGRGVKDIISDGAARRRFVNEIEMFGNEPSRRRALGWAYGMCGRSMNAHFLDEWVDAGTRPIPAGWSRARMAPTRSDSRVTAR